nr:14580_t:CDS:2 [Entrophospora candida]
MYDLKDISKATNAKMVIIPRTNVRYVHKRFEIFYYDSEEVKNQAVTTSFTIGNNELEWAGANAHTCHLCGSTNHLVADSYIKQKRDTACEKDQRFINAYKKYGIQKSTFKKLNTIKQDIKKIQQQINTICGEEDENNTVDNSDYGEDEGMLNNSSYMNNKTKFNNITGNSKEITSVPISIQKNKITKWQQYLSFLNMSNSINNNSHDMGVNNITMSNINNGNNENTNNNNKFFTNIEQEENQQLFIENETILLPT